MKYFEFRHSSDPKVIGVRTGIGQVRFDKNSFDDQNSYEKVVNFFSMKNYHSSNDHTPPFDIQFTSMWLEKQGKLTDFMDFNPYLMACPCLISVKAADILSKFRLADHYLFPATIVDKKGNKYQYQLLYMPLLEYSVIDFHQSEFISKDSLTGNTLYSTFESEEEYITFMKNHPFINAKKLKFNEKFDTGTHLINLKGEGFFGSEILVNTLENSGCTGFNFIPSHFELL